MFNIFYKQNYPHLKKNWNQEMFNIFYKQNSQK